MFLRMAALLAVTLGSNSSEKDIKNYAALENPFRMQKINLGVCIRTVARFGVVLWTRFRIILVTWIRINVQITIQNV